MRILDGLAALDAARGPAADSGSEGLDQHSAVLIGVFDGVHLGHQRLLHELLEFGSELEALPTVVTFKNHPDELLRGRPTPWIVSLPHRLRLLRRAGVQRVVLLEFDDALRDTSAEDFCRRVLVDGLRAKGVLLGYDSAIGKNREGTPQRFRELGAQFGFAVREGSLFLVNDRPVSSTAIREAIQAGDLATSQRMLGRWPGALGTVIQGDGRGRTLGFPTANLRPDNTVLPPPGVYAVEVTLEGEVLPGVANLGVRPTVKGEDGETLLEVHLFDQQRDLYGATLEVGFVARIREERKFPDLNALKAQIAQDLESARRVLGT